MSASSIQFHSLSLDAHIERVQRLMWTAARSKPIREASTSITNRLDFSDTLSVCPGFLDFRTLVPGRAKIDVDVLPPWV